MVFGQVIHTLFSARKSRLLETGQKHKKPILRDLLVILVALLDDVIIVVLILLALWFFKISITLPIIIVLVVFFGIASFISYKAIMPILHKRRSVGLEAMIGMEGKVIEPLIPFGTVRVKGEYWKAKSTGENIETGTDVEVVGLDRLKLEVKRKIGDK